MQDRFLACIFAQKRFNRAFPQWFIAEIDRSFLEGATVQGRNNQLPPAADSQYTARYSLKN